MICLPPDLAERLSKEQTQLFVSLDESQQRLLLKQSGQLPSEATLTCALVFAQIGLNRKVAQKARSDALQAVIMDILKTRPSLTWKGVVYELGKRKGLGVVLGVQGDAVEWRGEGGKVKITPIDAIEDRVFRAKKKFTR